MVKSRSSWAGADGLMRGRGIDLEALARRAADKLAEAFKDQRVAVTVTGPLPTVEGDPVLLERVFANLLSNGAKYNAAPVKRIEIGMEGAAVAVRDNGVGIDPKDHQAVFELFNRGRVNRDEDREGVGLGLALVKNIMEAHGGRVSLRSELGHGTTFLLSFPARPEPPPRPEVRVVVSEGAAERV